MATLQERESEIKLINERNRNIIALDIENDLIKKEKLGVDLNFEILRDKFILILETAAKVEQCDLSKTPYTSLANYSNTIGQIDKTLGQIKAFTVNRNSPINERNQFINQVNSQIDTLIEHSTPILIVDLLKGNDLALEKAKVQSLIEEIKNDKEAATKENETIKNELKTTLDSAKRAAAQVGVAQHSIVFKEESETHSQEASNWLKWTIGVLIGTAAAGIAFMFWTPSSSESATHVVQFTITKVVVLAVLFYGLSICVKNYRAHKHNAILNKHRQNALQTFETFIKASTDDQTKNAVLLQTTQSIFSNQQTGYSSGENDGDMPSKVIEIIKSTNPKNQA